MPRKKKIKRSNVTDDVNYAIMALDPATGDVTHVCTYAEKPLYGDFIALYNELREDPKFELQDCDFVLVLAEEKEFKMIKEEIENEENVTLIHRDEKPLLN